jgi:hypothetical protein
MFRPHLHALNFAARVALRYNSPEVAMKRSALLDGLLLTAVGVSALSLLLLMRAVPEECLPPESGKASYGPCLASSFIEFDRAPPPTVGNRPGQTQPVIVPAPLPPDARISIRPSDDVEVTGSVGPRRP